METHEIKELERRLTVLETIQARQDEDVRDLKQEIHAMRTEFGDKLEKVLTKIDDMAKSTAEQMTEFTKFQYKIMGGLILIGAVAGLAVKFIH